jgi:hypothetical protein
MSDILTTLKQFLDEDSNIEGLVYDMSTGYIANTYGPDMVTKEVAEKVLLYEYQWIEGELGGEGSGEYCYGVFKFDGKFYKTEWSYYSYEGCNWDNIEHTLKEVKPVEKLVTVYE